jgi:CRISPR/Cas system-associated endonuclease Cas1
VTPQEIANAETGILQVTQQLLSAYLRAKAIIIFVDKKGGLAGASPAFINAYNAQAQFVALLENQATVQGDYLATLTQATTHPQF